MDELALVRKLKGLPTGARRDLLFVLQSPPESRARLIGPLHAREDTRDLAESLIDLEEDELLRWTVVALLAAAKGNRVAGSR
jgi:hypothetical protein